jgi:hypothetical protein
MLENRDNALRSRMNLVTHFSREVVSFWDKAKEADGQSETPADRRF